MTWTSPMTAVSGAVFTAAQFNTNLRDNLNETAAALATAAGQIAVSDGANSLSIRTPVTAYIAANDTTTSVTYANIGTFGPVLYNVAAGTQALVTICNQSMNGATTAAYMGCGISQGNTRAESDDRSTVVISAQYQSASITILEQSLTPAGNNEFCAHYRASSGTAYFLYRRIIIIPL